MNSRKKKKGKKNSKQSFAKNSPSSWLDSISHISKRYIYWNSGTFYKSDSKYILFFLAMSLKVGNDLYITKLWYIYIHVFCCHIVDFYSKTFNSIKLDSN